MIPYGEYFSEEPTTDESTLQSLDSGGGFYGANHFDCAAVLQMDAASHLPDDMDSLKAALLEANTALVEARAKLFGAEQMIQHPQLVIAKMKREMARPLPPRCAAASKTA